MAETAVVVTVAAAERAVSEHRRAHMPGGGEGMPAHITLLYPFVPSESFEPSVVEGLRGVVTRFAPFTLTLRRLARFEGPPSVLYAVPEPDGRLRGMTAALSSAFGLLPYGGIHPEVIPHLAIAISDDLSRLAAIEAQVAAALPISQHVDYVDVWRHDPGGWARIHRIALA